MTAPPVLLFDGDCGFCTSSARWMERRLPAPPAIEAWQLVDVKALGVAPEECSRAVQWVGADGRHASGSRAIGWMLLTQNRPLGALGSLALVPPTSWLADGLYRVIARYRYRLPGGTPACRVASAVPGV